MPHSHTFFQRTNERKQNKICDIKPNNSHRISILKRNYFFRFFTLSIKSKNKKLKKKSEESSFRTMNSTKTHVQIQLQILKYKLGSIQLLLLVLGLGLGCDGKRRKACKIVISTKPFATALNMNRTYNEISILIYPCFSEQTEASKHAM